MGKGSTTRRYTDEFKRDAVALYRSSGRPIKEVARELGISDTSLGTWVREWEKTAPADQVESARPRSFMRMLVVVRSGCGERRGCVWR